MPFSLCASGSFARAPTPGSASMASWLPYRYCVHRCRSRRRCAQRCGREPLGRWRFQLGAPVELESDYGSLFFNDKESVTIDPTDTRYVYAVWDRLDTGNRGPTRFARSQDGGLSWEPAVTIYDPGAGAADDRQHSGCGADGIVYDFFTELVRCPAIRTWYRSSRGNLFRRQRTELVGTRLHGRFACRQYAGSFETGSHRARRRDPRVVRRRSRAWYAVCELAGLAVLKRRAQCDCACMVHRWRRDMDGTGPGQCRSHCPAFTQR